MNKKILVVGDELLLATAVKEFLIEQKHDAIVAANVDEALAALTKNNFG